MGARKGILPDSMRHFQFNLWHTFLLAWESSFLMCFYFGITYSRHLSKRGEPYDNPETTSRHIFHKGTGESGWQRAKQEMRDGESETESESQSCLTLCGPMDYPVQEILQARILEWV